MDADPLGLRLAPDNDAALIAAAQRIIPAVNRQLAIRHPERPDINRCYQTLLTSAATGAGDLKQTIVCPPGSLDRSPCGTGTSARVAALHTRGELPLHQAARFEGVLGTCFIGEAVAAEERAGVLYVTPKVTGRAWITGFHQFVLDPDDPLPDGFRIGHPPARRPIRKPGADRSAPPSMACARQSPALFPTFRMLECAMALVTIKDKFQVTLPAKLRARIGVRVGDLMDATVHEDGILLRPKAVVDRKAVADELERLLSDTAVAPDDQGRPEGILEDAIADVAAARRRRQRCG